MPDGGMTLTAVRAGFSLAPEALFAGVGEFLGAAFAPAAAIVVPATVGGIFVAKSAKPLLTLDYVPSVREFDARANNPDYTFGTLMSQAQNTYGVNLREFAERRDKLAAAGYQSLSGAGSEVPTALDPFVAQEIAAYTKDLKDALAKLPPDIRRAFIQGTNAANSPFDLTTPAPAAATPPVANPAAPAQYNLEADTVPPTNMALVPPASATPPAAANPPRPSSRADQDPADTRPPTDMSLVPSDEAPPTVNTTGSAATSAAGATIGAFGAAPFSTILNSSSPSAAAASGVVASASGQVTIPPAAAPQQTASTNPIAEPVAPTAPTAVPGAIPTPAAVPGAIPTPATAPVAQARTAAQPVAAPTAAPAATSPPQLPTPPLPNAPSGPDRGSLRGINFDFDSVELDAAAKAAIAAKAEEIKKAGIHHGDGHVVEVDGYTDAVGGDSRYNQELGERRAEAVAAEMKRDGVDADIKIVSHSDHDLVENTKGRSRANRRALVDVKNDAPTAAALPAGQTQPPATTPPAAAPGTSPSRVADRHDEGPATSPPAAPTPREANGVTIPPVGYVM